jgi:hypothetical protein
MSSNEKRVKIDAAALARFTKGPEGFERCVRVATALEELAPQGDAWDKAQFVSDLLRQAVTDAE